MPARFLEADDDEADFARVDELPRVDEDRRVTAGEEVEVDTMPLAAISLNAYTQILKIKEIENLLLSFIA